MIASFDVLMLSLKVKTFPEMILCLLTCPVSHFHPLPGLEAEDQKCGFDLVFIHLLTSVSICKTSSQASKLR